MKASLKGQNDTYILNGYCKRLSVLSTDISFLYFLKIERHTHDYYVCSWVLFEEKPLIKSNVEFSGYMFFMPIKINGALKMFINVSSKIMLKSCMWYVNQTRTRWGAGICLGDGGSHSALCPLPMWCGQMTVSNVPGFLTGEMKMLLPSSQLRADTNEMVLVGKPGAAAHTWPMVCFCVWSWMEPPGCPSCADLCDHFYLTMAELSSCARDDPKRWWAKRWSKIFTLWPFIEKFASSWELLDHECKTRFLVHCKF